MTPLTMAVWLVADCGLLTYQITRHYKKKRLEILERDDYICQSCNDVDSELHVHHITYFPDLQPWEYDNKYLITVCDNCHKEIHSYKKENRYIVDIFSMNVDFSKEMNVILNTMLDFLNNDFSKISDVRRFIIELNKKTSK
jgi:hypothetical protein